LKYIFLFIITLSSLFASIPTINIDSDTTKLTNFQLEYFEDETLQMSLEDIKKQNFTKDSSRLSLGLLTDNIWLRFNLHNKTNKRQKLFIHNEHAYLSNTLDFFEIFNDTTINRLTILLNSREDTQEKMYGKDAIFIITLESNQTKTVYINNMMKIMQYPYFTIYDDVSSKKRLAYNSNLSTLILGMLIALAFYHFMLYLTTSYKEYLYYTLYLTGAVIWEAFFSGVMASSFGVYFNDFVEKILLVVILLPLFLTLFTKSLLNTKKSFKVENRFLNSIIFFSLVSLFIGLYDSQLSLIPTSILYIYMFIVLFITSYSIMKKGNPFAFTFLLANTLFSLLMSITNLYYLGFIHYSPFIFDAALIGVIFEALILSTLLSYRVKLLQKSKLKVSQELISHIEKSRKQDKILFAQKKMYSMGEMLENIAHQWRQPLAQVNASVLTIDNILYENNHTDAKIEKELINIENLTNYMSRTIDSFRGFFNKNREAKEFSIKNIINSSVLILDKSLQDNVINITQEIESDFLYKGYENELQQVILVILNNAKEALTSKKTINPQITIKIVNIENDYKISICDNAGGIDNKIFDKIFDPYFTTKHQKQGTGIGLYMSKIIIEDNMNGQISARNITNGVCFNIFIPKN